MPRYAVDFLAEIQELTSATNLDDCSDSVDLLTNCNHFAATDEERTAENNVASAHMGNAQCCFKRYPGYQSHRHVVVSRGVQCNGRKNSDVDSNNLFGPHATERGDGSHDLLRDTKWTPGAESQQRANVDSNTNLTQFLRSKPDVVTLVTEEPPELRESSKFFRKKFSMDYKKGRKYLDEDIDSLSATISNYSFHDRLQKFDPYKIKKDRIFEEVDKNNHQSSNATCMTPVPFHCQSGFKGSTDAIRGSTTKTITCRSHETKMSNKIDNMEIQSSESYGTFGHAKGPPNGNNSEVAALKMDKDKESTVPSRSVALAPSNDDIGQQCPACSVQPPNVKTRVLIADNLHEEKPFKSNSDSKCSSSVTFMKGSEEIHDCEKAKTLEFNNINVLRRKQKFLMRHTRISNKLVGDTNCVSPVVAPALELPAHPVGGPVEGTGPGVVTHTPVEVLQTLPESMTQKQSSRNTQPTPSNNDQSRNSCTSRNSNHSEHATLTPATNTLKMKRTVSFDRNRTEDQTNRSFSEHKNESQTCTRNTVRAKYCSKKIIKQRFYIPETANIEHILRDPSDRRIKAICDRHNCDIEIYSKVPKSGFLKNIIVLAAPNSENLRKCIRSLDYSMCWCLTAQLP